MGLGPNAPLVYTRVSMASRLTALLLAVAALLAPAFGALTQAQADASFPTAARGLGAAPAFARDSAAASTSAIPQRSGCCGDACRCDQTCPCIARDERNAPTPDAPSLPAPTRDQRTVLLSLPSLVATLLAQLPDAASCRCARHQPSAADHGRPDSGRGILSLVSRWTT